MAALVSEYQALTETIAQLAAQEKTAREKRDIVMAAMREWLSDNNIERLTTNGLTIRTVVKQSPRVMDRDLFFAFVQETNSWHLVEASCVKKATLEALSIDSSIPGVYVHEVNTVHVSKAR